MEEINSYNENCFEVFLGEKMIGDVTDLLIRTIHYLKKIGKKVKLSKWLKVTKNRAGDAKITYKFTKRKYKKYATLSKKGVFKAKKAGKKKTVYVKAAAGDGSKKTANIKIKIK